MYSLMRLICKCGNLIDVWIDKFGVYYCDICECYHQVDVDD